MNLFWWGLLAGAFVWSWAGLFLGYAAGKRHSDDEDRDGRMRPQRKLEPVLMKVTKSGKQVTWHVFEDDAEIAARALAMVQDGACN